MALIMFELKVGDKVTYTMKNYQGREGRDPAKDYTVRGEIRRVLKNSFLVRFENGKEKIVLAKGLKHEQQ